MGKNIVINKHGSFYIRNGWPTKILDAINNNESIFSPNKELEAVDEIGVGRVMIKSMRYWASALGIAKEHKNSQGVLLKLTPLGELIKKYDPYFQRIGTLWLLHRNLTAPNSEATAWFWAFNLFHKKAFSKNDFCADFISYLQHEGTDYIKKAIEKEFDCFKNTYVSEKEFEIKKILEEDNAPFFSRLKLISYAGNGLFVQNNIGAQDIPLDVIYYCILNDNHDMLANSKQISVNHLLENDGQIGKYMCLTYSVLIEYLQRLENQNKITLINNFGNRLIQIVDDYDENTILKEYYIKEKKN